MESLLAVLRRRAEGRDREVDDAVAGLVGLLEEDGLRRIPAEGAAAATTAGPKFLWVAWLVGLLT